LNFDSYDAIKFDGDLTFKLDAATYWQILLDTGSVDNRYTNGDDVRLIAIVNSGTSLMVGPKSEMTKIAKTIGAQQASSFSVGEYMLDSKLVGDLP
jgi:saccharopepsin